MKLKQIERFVTEALDLFYPRRCPACNVELTPDERGVCAGCLTGIETTQFHENPTNNDVYRKFEGRCELAGASACFYFDKGGALQQLIHALKYENDRPVGRTLGRYYGYQLIGSLFVSDVKFIAPVPLHPSKLRTRGYNQAEEIARGMSEALNIKMEPNLIRRLKENESQTRKTRQERWENVQNIFAATNIKADSVLIVDDVVTTGATMLSAISSLQKAGVQTIKAASIALAR